MCCYETFVNFMYFLPCIIFANEIKLICENNGKLFNNNLNKRFSKIINFKNQTIENISGHSFDKLLVFNKYEVVMYNYIFDYSSSYIYFDFSVDDI